MNGVKNIKVTLVILATVNLFMRVISAEKRQFTCGFIYDGSSYHDAIQFAVNHTSAVNLNVSIALKMFHVSPENNLFDQVAEAFQQQSITVLIDGSQSKSHACALSIVTGIPLVRLHKSRMSSNQCKKTVDMSADYRYLAHATFAILNSFHWRKISLVFDEAGLLGAGYFYATFQNFNFAMNLVQLAKSRTSEEQRIAFLKAEEEITKFEPEVILLYTNKERTQLMLQQVPCDLKKHYKWILQEEVSLSLASLSNNVVLAFKLPYIPATIPGINITHTTQGNFQSNKRDFAAKAFDAVQVIHQALNTGPCLTLNESNTQESDKNLMFNCIRKINVAGFTGPVQFDEKGKRTVSQLDILNLRNNSFKRIGTWNATKGAVLFDEVSTNSMESYSHRERLDGRTFRIVVVEEPPFVTIKKMKDGTFLYEGYCVDLMNELAKILKFKYEFYLSPDGKYGGKMENGTWDGMVLEVLNGNADMASGAIAITEGREKVMDFSVPFMYYTEDLIMKKPSHGQESLDLLQFMNPFENLVWFCTLATLAVTSVAVFLLNYYSPYGYKNDIGEGTSDEFSFINSVWFALACMLQQGGDNTPRNLSGRILTGCYWFCILVWVSTYTANLAAFLTVKNAASPIKSLEDIAKTSHQVGVTASTSIYESFNNTQYEPHKKIWQRMKAENTFVQNTSQGIQLVRERASFVFINDGPILQYIANHRPCDLMTVPGLSRAKGLVLGFQAYDRHTMDFTLAILRLHENDFLDNLKRKWWDNANECPKEKETTLSQKRIDLPSMLGVYLVMGVGIVVAFMALIAEIFWKKMAKRGTKSSFFQRSVGLSSNSITSTSD